MYIYIYNLKNKLQKAHVFLAVFYVLIENEIKMLQYLFESNHGVRVFDSNNYNIDNITSKSFIHIHKRNTIFIRP